MVRRVLLVLVFPAVAAAQSVQDGKDVYGPCAACHGANGEGGKGGEYPRLAGQPPSFTLFSLKQFQERKRKNLPMFPYTEPRELSERDMKDVAAYLASLTLPTKLPEFKETDSALDRLLMMERVLVVPRVEGDVRVGKVTYRKVCAKCHGSWAQGRDEKRAPRLVGQYPDYLRRQIDAYKKGERRLEADDPMRPPSTSSPSRTSPTCSRGSPRFRKTRRSQSQPSRELTTTSRPAPSP